jgi:hypothetical protein
MIPRLLHALNLCGCAAGNTWHVDGVCVPLVTAQYERERKALAAHRAELAQRRLDRRAVVLAAARGMVE